MNKIKASNLAMLRALLKKNEIAAYIVPSSDAHQSEYVAPQDMRRGFVSGFDGSAGTAVITESQALLWTDGRYVKQALNQLSSDWELMRAGQKGVPKIDKWLATSLPSGARVGFDSNLTGVQTYETYSKTLKGKNIDFVAIEPNLVDVIWSTRPEPTEGKLLELGVTFSGQVSSEKLAAIRALLVKDDASAVVLSDLAEVAWLLNLRGNDIAFNPVFFAFVLITHDETTIYIDPAKVTESISKVLHEQLGKLSIKPYNDSKALTADLDTLDKAAAQSGKKVWLDPVQCSVRIHSSFGKDNILAKQSPVQLLKGVKNATELQGARNCHERDAIAVVEYLHWLDVQYATEGHRGYYDLNEYTAAEQLEQFRAKQEHFIGLSFPTISSINQNGAIIHYHAEDSKSAAPLADGMYLCDSGAQFKDGTTDITRTVCFGEPTAFQKRTFTRVLQGHIALACAVFPSGSVSGPKLDCLARGPLWAEGLDYLHGTGHGIGAFLNVHEGPHGISSSMGNKRVLNTHLEPGMLVTNEPGFYYDVTNDEKNNINLAAKGETGFGIRIENVMAVVKKTTQYGFAGKDYLGFDTITVVPIQKKLLDLSIMTSAEIKWLNDYHQQCRDAIGDRIAKLACKDWFEEATKEIVQ